MFPIETTTIFPSMRTRAMGDERKNQNAHLETIYFSPFQMRLEPKFVSRRNQERKSDIEVGRIVRPKVRL